MSVTGTAGTSYVANALADLHRRGLDFSSSEGSLVFADLSNFTPLTERLAKNGRVGSEQLTDLLNALFAPMLDVASGLGGDLLKFGGDALLIGFSADHHAESAITAAFRMQAELRSAARRERVRVGMSVGVASGEISLHLVGHRHPELVVAGRAVNRCLALEAAASEGQILVDVLAQARANVDARTAPNRFGLELIDLSHPVTDVRATPNRSGTGAQLLDPHVAAAVREGARPEHRQAVVGFLSFEIDPGDPPATRHGRLAELFEVVEDACSDMDITVINCDVLRGGGKLTLTAGVPLTSGDDADRMLQCVTRVVSASAAATAGVRVGVNEGRMFAGPIGSEARRCYTIMGDAVNVAARVMSAARAGEVLATTNAIDRTREHFEVGPVVEFAVKGKSSMISAAQVRRPTGRIVAKQIDSALRGRSEELQTITEVASRVVETGRGSVVEVVGEPGIGKSRLLREVIATSPLSVILIECGRFQHANPYGAVIERFRDLIGGGSSDPDRVAGRRLSDLVERLAPELVPWLPLLGIPLGVEYPNTEQTAAISPEFRLTRAHRLFSELLVKVFEVPQMLVVEDAHWLDAASSDLFDAVMPSLVDRGWLIVAARRQEDSGWTPEDPALRMELMPLTPTDSRELVGDLLAGHSTPDHLARLLVDRSHGNPLFLEELAAAISAGARPDELPDRIEALIEAHIDRLPANGRLVLRTAAVLGARFDRDLLATLAGTELQLDGLSRFLTVSDSEVRFRHALLRDTAYQTLPVKERVRLHEHAALALERRAGDNTSEYAELLAEHWFDAQRYGRAWTFLLSAAERARSDLAPFEASRFLERALECLPHLGSSEREQRHDLEEQLGSLYDILARYADAEQCFQRARRHAPDAETRARLRGLEGHVARSTRSLSTAVRRYRRALGEVPSGAPGVRAELCVGLAAVYERQGRHREKLDLLNEAIRDATLAGDAGTLAHAHLVLGNTYGDLGTGPAEYHLTTALALFDHLGEIWGVASARNNLGVEAYFAGDWRLALEHYGSALEGYRRIGDEFNTAMALNNIGEIHSDQGEWTLARAELEEAGRTWSGSGLGVAFVSSNLARLLCRTGDLDAAREEFERARLGLKEVGAAGYIQELDTRVAVLLLKSGDAQGALNLAEHVLEHGGELQPTVRCQLVRTCGAAAHALGRHEVAADRFVDALTTAETSGAAYERALTLMARARLEPDDDALHLAATIFDELGVLDPARNVI